MYPRSRRAFCRLTVSAVIAVTALGLAPAPARTQAPATAATPAAEPITVMSFNIRYGTANDGENHWSRRRELVFDVIREQNADLIGLQEALAFQIDEIIAAAPAYAVVGVGRDDGRAKGEFSAISARSVPAEPVIVTGDFNVGESHVAIKTLLATPPGGTAPFVDTLRVRDPGATDVGTFTGFTFGKPGQDKIDYVLVQPGTDVLDAAIVRTSRNERYPSDHFPVVARIRLRRP